MTNETSSPEVKIVLVLGPDGTFREKDGEVYWTRTGYTNGACPDGSDCTYESCEMGHDVCYVCKKDILDDQLFTCLDDGSVNAHFGCVTHRTGR